jgi:peptidoglycan/LPS O-acetylase OafA/YrhL
VADITKGHRRILALDGLRGIAALSIYIYHVDVVRHRGGPFSHGYLAVDFFFLLSGFVIGEAYELRMASGLPTLDYMRLRLIRLYPMIAMGAALGLIIGFFRFHFNIWLSFVAQLAFIPFVVGIEAYPLNGVQWSLLFELIANCVHAIARRFLSTRNLAGFVILAAPGLAATDIHYGNLNVGFTPENFWGGFARVGFSFGAGLLIYRQYAAGRLPRLNAPYLVVALALVVALGWPGDHPALPDSSFVIALFPLIMIAAIHSHVPSRVQSPTTFLGNLSYPLYAIHLPLLNGAAVAIATFPTLRVRGIAWLLVILGVLLMAWLADVFYDTPARRALAEIWKFGGTKRPHPHPLEQRRKT